MVYNAITPSGTNNLHGDGELPVPAQPDSRVAVLLRLRQHARAKPDTEARRRRHGHRRAARSSRTSCTIYGGWRARDRSLVTGGQVITVTPADARALGHQAAAGERRRTPAAPEGQVRLRQVRLPDVARQPAVGPLYPASTTSRRPTSAAALTTLGARDQLPRRDGLDGGPARVDDREQQAERAARAVRASPPVPHANGDSRHRAGDYRSGNGVAFGGRRGIGEGNAGFDFKQDITQVIDNFT